MYRSAFLAFLFFAAGAPLASADSSLVEDLAKQAQAHSASTVEALQTLRQAEMLVSSQGTLSFRKAMFVQDAPQGFGLYTPRANNIFKDGERLFIYMEPVALKWDNQDDIYHSLTTIDYEVQTPDGKILAGQHDFGTMELKSRDPNQEVMYRVNLQLSGARPGKYILVLTCHEKSSGKTASAQLPFEFQ
ncbi:MAG: hypothetical protein ABSC72_09435 [Methylovirgula sp.]|jgi:hypothetical protein